jgi:hypothetical protein
VKGWTTFSKEFWVMDHEEKGPRGMCPKKKKRLYLVATNIIYSVSNISFTYTFYPLETERETESLSGNLALSFMVSWFHGCSNCQSDQ